MPVGSAVWQDTDAPRGDISGIDRIAKVGPFGGTRASGDKQRQPNRDQATTSKHA